MNVTDLIKRLKTFPKEYEVYISYSGKTRFLNSDLNVYTFTDGSPSTKNKVFIGD